MKTPATVRAGCWKVCLVLIGLFPGPVQASTGDLPPGFSQALMTLEANGCPAAVGALQAMPEPPPESIRHRVSFLTGFCLLKTQQPAEALVLLEQAATEYDLLADYATFYAAKAAQALQDPGKSIVLLARLLARYPNSRLAEEAHFQLGSTYLEMQQFEDARKTLLAFLDRYPASPLASQASLLLAKLLLKLERPQEAAPLLKRLYISFPADPTAVEAERLLRANPDLVIITAEDRLLRARAFFQADRYRDAVAALTPLLKSHPGSGEVRLLLGRSQFALKEYPQAITTLHPLTESHGPSALQAEALLLVGRAFFRSGDTGQAIATLERIPVLFPGSHLAADALHLIGLNYEERREEDAALETYARLLRLYPNENLGDIARWQRAWLLYRQGKLQPAVHELSQLLEKYPQSPLKAQALYWRGRMLEELGDRTLATKTYRRLLKEAGDDPYYLQAARQRLALKPAKLSTESVLPPENSASPAVAKARELSFLRLWDEAAQEYWEIARVHPRELPLQREACEALSRASQFDRCISLARRAARGPLKTTGQDGVPSSFWMFLYPRAFWAWVDHYAGESRLDPYLVIAVIREESAFAPKALSRAGAKGLMQLLPATAAQVAKENNLRNLPDLDTPAPNIALGTRYLAKLHEEFGGNLVLTLASYNAGPHVVRRWLDTLPPSQDPEIFIEEIPYPETRRYVKRVLGSYDRYRTLYGRP
jgi:soluble lytic murein transglycosylase